MLNSYIQLVVTELYRFFRFIVTRTRAHAHTHTFFSLFWLTLLLTPSNQLQSSAAEQGQGMEFSTQVRLILDPSGHGFDVLMCRPGTRQSLF
jgi:hypothetical protein